MLPTICKFLLFCSILKCWHQIHNKAKSYQQLRIQHDIFMAMKLLIQFYLMVMIRRMCLAHKSIFFIEILYYACSYTADSKQFFILLTSMGQSQCVPSSRWTLAMAIFPLLRLAFFPVPLVLGESGRFPFSGAPTPLGEDGTMFSFPLASGILLCFPYTFFPGITPPN